MAESVATGIVKRNTTFSVPDTSEISPPCDFKCALTIERPSPSLPDSGEVV